MCKLAFCKTENRDAYEVVLRMIEYQENKVAGHSTGLSWIDKKGLHIRKAVGKVINFKAKYLYNIKTNICLGHSRYATVGVINENNQHPISIMYKGKRIGYGVHNGMWDDYVKFEYKRNTNLTNVTDSALLFTIYSDILEKYGDNKINRMKALSTMKNFTQKNSNQNFIILFNNGQVLLMGNNLTYEEYKNEIGIMSFGLSNSIEENKIYEVIGLKLIKYDNMFFNDYYLEPKEIKKPIYNSYYGYNFNNYNTNKKHELNSNQTTFKGKFRFFDGLMFRLFKVDYETQEKAQEIGEVFKKKYNYQYRTFEQPNKKYSLYLRGKK